MARMVYMDHAATTATRPEVVNAMFPYYFYKYGNPSNGYLFSQNSKNSIENSRKIIADSLNGKPENIFFTSGGSESDNWALKGIAQAYKKRGRHIITSSIEHHAVLYAAKYLEQNGFEVTYLPINQDGMIDIENLKKAIRPDTIMISIMFANNEIGTFQPIAEIGKLARKYHIIFHTDAVQAFGQIPIDVDALNIDLLSASGHKFYGPKGVGFLYVRDGIMIDNLIHGGGQESGKRAGTEAVANIVGIGKATEYAMATIKQRIDYETWLRDYMIEKIMEQIPYCRLNGHRDNRLPNNINISFQFVDSEALIVMLDMVGICASGGSACASGNHKPSHVLLALGLSEDLARGTLRLTLGEENTKQEVDYVVSQLKYIVGQLRETSPDYEDFVKYNKISLY